MPKTVTLNGLKWILVIIAVLGFLGGVSGWVIYPKSQQIVDEAQNQKIEQLVGKIIGREQYLIDMQRIEKTLERIEKKLDNLYVPRGTELKGL